MLIRFKSVCEKLCLSRNGLHRLIMRDPTFPKAIKFSSARQANIYFVLQEVEDWIESKKDLQEERHD